MPTMTIAISLKVNDGIVLAADSASTIIAQDTRGGQVGVSNIYNNASKICNLKKGLPIGVIMWGSGSIGQSSMSTLTKDFRELITKATNWKIDDINYTVREVAEKFKKFIFDDSYIKEFRDWKRKPDLGFIVAGYSVPKGKKASFAEEWKCEILNGQCSGPDLIREPSLTGLTWSGMPEAITRLYKGYGTALPEILKACTLDEIKINEIMEKCRDLTVPMLTPPMPIQDAIDLSAFLVEATINFSRFAPGAPMVGGPIEIAAITKHEGFKWVRRKHYYKAKHNPE